MTAEALRSTFPGRDNASLAVTLVRLLAQGEPVTTAALARSAARTLGDVAAPKWD